MHLYKNFAKSYIILSYTCIVMVTINIKQQRSTYIYLLQFLNIIPTYNTWYNTYYKYKYNNLTVILLNSKFEVKKLKW